MIRTIAAVVCLGLALSVSMPAFADKGGVPNANAANGQANASQNCSENIAKQNANGQTSGNTGNSKDSKQDVPLDTAVTNCDGYWHNN